MAIHGASICLFSSGLISYCVQLSHTTFAFSKTGLIKEILIISSDCLSRMNFNLRILFNLVQALEVICSMC